MQKGRIYRKGHSWILDYGVKVNVNGQPVWRNRSKKLARVSDEFRTAASVRHLASELLADHNAKITKPESVDSVSGFIQNSYLPHCQTNLTPSTVAGYQYLFKLLKPYLQIRLRDFTPVDGERVLNQFASEKLRAGSQLKNVKQFLSGTFRYAVRTGVIRFNPMRETVLPKGKPKTETYAYSIPEIQQMLKVLEEPERTIVLVAALTGLRMSEIRGLKWEDFQEDRLFVRRSVWRNHVGETKTAASNASVPVLAVVAKALNAHRKTSNREFIFQGATGRPLVLANIARRDIKPKLTAANIPWSGFHGFRRGLATNLYALGVLDKTIMEILRHADVSVTQRHYIKTSTSQTVAAMAQLEKAFLKAK